LDELIQRERQRVRARRIRLAIGTAAACIVASLGAAWIYVDVRIERHIENGRAAMMSRDFARAAPWLVSATALQEAQPLARKRPYLAAMLGITMAQVERLEGIQSFPGTARFLPAVDAARRRVAIALNESKIVVATLHDSSEQKVYDIPEKDVMNMRFDEK